MSSFFPKRPVVGSTDWAAKQFLDMLDREEREKAGQRRLQRIGWRPAASSARPSDSDPRFGDGRDAIADLVRAEIDYRQALHDEARRHVATQLAQVQSDAPFIPSRKPDLRNMPAYIGDLPIARKNPDGLQHANRMTEDRNTRCFGALFRCLRYAEAVAPHLSNRCYASFNLCTGTDIPVIFPHGEAVL